MTLQSQPVVSLTPFEQLNPGKVVSIHSVSYVSGRLVSSEVAERVLKSALEVLKAQFPPEEVTYTSELQRDHHGTDGCGIQITAATSTGCLISASGLGEKGLPAEEVGQNAAKKLIEDVTAGGCVDEHIQDQVLIFMALAEGKSRVRTGPISLHSKTAIHFLQLLTGCKFTITPTGEYNYPTEESYIIECEGIGFKNPHLSSVPTPTSSSSSSSSSSTSSSTSNSSSSSS